MNSQRMPVMVCLMMAISVTCAWAEEPEAELSVPLAESTPKPQPNPLSVNITEEYSFASRQNIDGFLGEFVNPLKSIDEDKTYSGSRSEKRQDESRGRWWE